jgi:hypothetical protein
MIRRYDRQTDTCTYTVIHATTQYNIDDKVIQLTHIIGYNPRLNNNNNKIH